MAKVQRNIAKRYARALFQSYEINALDGVNLALKDLSQIWGENIELRQAILNPAVPQKTRIATIAEIVGLVRSGDVVLSNLISLLVENGRVHLLPAISESFSQMYDNLKQMLNVEIVTAREVSPSERTEIEQKVRSDLGSLVTFAWGLDKKILGGMLIKSGDRLLDGSVSGALERVKNQLLR